MTTIEKTIYSQTGVESQALIEAFYSQMYTIRKVEMTLLDLYAQGLLVGTVHTSMGQEACDVGVINALDGEKDIIFSNHRAHGQFIAYCDDVEGLIAEIMGKESGVCKGIGGSQHIHKRNMYTNGVQGGIVPNAVGAALSEKIQGTGAVTVVFLGDGTMGEGTVYESMNIASLWSLPIVFVLVDNGIAQSTPKALEHAGDLSTRATSFAVKSASFAAHDVSQVYSAACAIISDVRAQSRPFFLHLKTARLGPHSKGDDTRSKAELESLQLADPLPKIAALLPEPTRSDIEKMVEERIRKAVQAAIASPHPKMSLLRSC